MRAPRPLDASARFALLALLLAAPGCAKRYRFEPTELDRVQTVGTVDPLRVYSSEKLVVIYDQADVAEQYQVQRQIQQSSARARIKEIITRDTAGKIVAVGEQNGAPFLAVTFDPSCAEASCAYGFVQTEDGAFRLFSAPVREGFAEAKLYRGAERKKRRLSRGKMASLAEANEVFTLKKRSGKITTIQLEVKKVVDDEVRTKVQRNRGIQ